MYGTVDPRDDYVFVQFGGVDEVLGLVGVSDGFGHFLVLFF